MIFYLKELRRKNRRRDMKENKYKVWCKNNNEWEKGKMMFFCDGSLAQLKNGLIIPCKQETHIIVFYTGLKDKNGKEIFEGSIDSKRRVVEYLTNMSGYYLMKNGEGVHLSHSQFVKDGCLKHIEVIGNIYENPELLK